MDNIFYDVQELVANQLNQDPQLSANCTFLAENRKDIDFEIKNALGRQGIVGLVLTPKATYAGKYENLYLAWQIDELEIDIVENPTVNRGKKDGYMTGQDVSMRLYDVLCPTTGEQEGAYCPVGYEQGEDNGLLVNKCVLKTLVYGDHGDTPTPDEPITFKFVKLLDEPPAEGVQPKDGWMWKQGGKMYLCAGQEIKVLGGVQEDEMSAYVESQVSSKADLSVFENECWKKDDAVISAGFGFTTQGFNSVSDDWGEDFLFGDGAAMANYNSSGALILEDKRVTSQALYDTAIITSRGIRQISKRGNGEPVIHGTLVFPRNDSEQTNLATEKWVEGQISAKADLSALANYLPLSGSTMRGTIGFSPDADWEHDLGYKLIQLNQTGEYWQALFGVDDYHGQPFVAHNGSETGTGEIGEYTWRLWFPDENGTLATREWTKGEISAKADLSALSSKADLSSLDDYAKIDELSAKADLSSLARYLPLSGGTLSGTLNAQSVYGGQFTTNSDCQTGGGQTYTSFGNNGILMGRSPNLLRVLWPFNQELGNDQTFATEEWVGGQISAKADISALNLALDRLATKAKYRDDTVSSFLFIGDTPEVFPNRDNVVEVELGLGVSAIGLFTFNGATRLKSVKCNEGLVEIKGGSFSGCTSLSSINFPSTLTAIYGDGAIFGNCRSLHDLDFPESLERISQYTFLDAPISSAIFRGKTMEQVSAMANYPWAIQRSAISTWNAASQEWVLQQLSSIQARLEALENN